MFVVKKLGKNGTWSAVSLIDENGSFRGEAKFETRKEAEQYMEEYVVRMKSRHRSGTSGYGEIRVFDESKQEGEEEVKKKKKPSPKTRKSR
ncbi:MAG: hypothetical protein HRF40_10960 [Nitrososphaera sp.]|jgi:uncharacterized protein YrzB (UPF0473 family)